ncbi:MAG: VCBS repeat-containing protein [Myxococcales bacterium]|nr:VCBS repeat-containing protein [Myxococcales bacterium]
MRRQSHRLGRRRPAATDGQQHQLRGRLPHLDRPHLDTLPQLVAPRRHDEHLVALGGEADVGLWQDQQCAVRDTGDLDGDGRPEFLIGGSPNDCMRFEVWTGVADEAYVRLARVDYVGRDSIPTNQGITAFGDLDGDGDAELVINVCDAIVAWGWDGTELW